MKAVSALSSGIKAHKNLVPARRQLVALQGIRDRRFATEPEEAYQMDWGCINVLDYDGTEYTTAYFAGRSFPSDPNKG